MSAEMTKATPIKMRDATAGSHITDVCAYAVKIAHRMRNPVSFDFNGQTVIANPTDTAGNVQARWQKQMDDAHEAWRNSDEGRAHQQRKADELASRQRRTDDLMATLDEVIGSPRELVAWCVKLSQCADWIGVTWKPVEVAQRLEDAGYKRDDCVGLSQDRYDDQDTAIRYLLGQAIDCMYRRMAPHPVIESMAEKMLSR